MDERRRHYEYLEEEYNKKLNNLKSWYQKEKERIEKGLFNPRDELHIQTEENRKHYFNFLRDKMLLESKGKFILVFQNEGVFDYLIFDTYMEARIADIPSRFRFITKVGFEDEMSKERKLGKIRRPLHCQSSRPEEVL